MNLSIKRAVRAITPIKKMSKDQLIEERIRLDAKIQELRAKKRLVANLIEGKNV